MERGEGSSSSLSSTNPVVLGVSKSMREDMGSIREMSTHLCIYNVPKVIRRENEEEYTPNVVSIGPIHHKDATLIQLQKKYENLRNIIIHNQTNDIHGELLVKYLGIIDGREADIRSSYAYSTAKISSEEFIQLVLLDTFFIIQLVRRNLNTRRHSIGMPFELKEYARDILLAENQLPFFILEELYDAAFPAAQDSFTVAARKFLGLENIPPVPPTSIGESSIEMESSQSRADARHLLDLVRLHYLPTILKSEGSGAAIVHEEIICPTATSLCEAGITFQVNAHAHPRLLDLVFDPEEGTLYIPKLRMEDETETLFRNLVAFEQSHHDIDTYIVDYLFFLDCLVKTPKDIHLLTNAGVIENWVGCQKTLSKVFNTMGRHAYSFKKGYLYSGITTQLNSYHDRKWNRYKATLMQVYFCHPWAMIPVFYAAVLLLFTMAQLVVGILTVPGVLHLGHRDNSTATT